MSLTIKLKGKGKRRVLDGPETTVAGENEPPHPTKRPKRAETRQCPICDEHIPLRLLAKHAELETERLDEIMDNIGSEEADEVFNEWTLGEPGPSTRRLSALRARKSLSSSSTPINASSSNSIATATQTIQRIKRRRKARHARLKELLRADVEGEGDAASSSSWVGRFTGEEIDCPVCSNKVRGDEDVVNAHVDACLAYEVQRMDEAERERQREAEAMSQWGDEEADDFGTYVGNLRGAGFHTRNAHQEDVEHEIDIEGDDQAVYGEAQFSEGDVVPVNRSSDQQNDEDELEVNIEDEEEDDAQLGRQTLRDLVTARKGDQPQESTQPRVLAKDGSLEDDRVNTAVAIARQRHDQAALIRALEDKVKHLEADQPPAIATDSHGPSCKICLDPYAEPTVSTGCWHTCCKKCWLKCLGSTKLCPICKRITSATELRRIYL